VQHRAAKIKPAAAVMEITFARMDVAPWSSCSAWLCRYCLIPEPVGVRRVFWKQFVRTFLVDSTKLARALVGHLQRAQEVHEIQASSGLMTSAKEGMGVRRAVMKSCRDPVGDAALEREPTAKL